MANNRVQRNDKCPCGSGLKHKKCHGDMQLANMATSAAKIVATMNIARRVYDADPATESQYREGTLQMIKVLNNMLPDGIAVIMVDAEETEPEIDKLAEKAESGSSLEEVQRDMAPCPSCLTMLPNGMMCAKSQCRIDRVKGEQS
ncbi:hypothetical protein LCGC14_0411360 [marine sediment metagenome]|uniref:Uncharacterized protein n=1 Tax=marine sediment metagenome TaxID=412755 RepID=A0A0F9W301_9ZZZZ